MDRVCSLFLCGRVKAATERSLMLLSLSLSVSLSLFPPGSHPVANQRLTAQPTFSLSPPVCVSLCLSLICRWRDNALIVGFE